MSGRLDPPLVPRDGDTIRLLVPVRISDPTKQDERSLGDQRDKIERWIRPLVDRPIDITVIEGRESGELIDREDFKRLVGLVETRRYDAVVAEDLGRIVRRLRAHVFCEECLDFGTRVIAINDNVDTARQAWQDASIFSAWHHERSNRDTSDRIKRTQRSRFTSGGCLPCEMYGWIKPPGAKNDAEVHKDPAAEAVYLEWFRMLDEVDDTSFADVARWLNASGTPLPPHARNGRWDGKMVGRHTYNVLLKGVRERNRRKTKRLGSGKYLSIKAEPQELMQRTAPHLAFFEEAYFDRVVAKLKARNGPCRRADHPGVDPCANRPKKDTRFPGRVTFCGVCGRVFVWGGHGQTDHMMCNGARLHRCWNGATFDGPEAARRVAAAVMGEVEALEEFDATFVHLVAEEAGRLDGERDRRIADLQRQLRETEREVSNVVAFIRGGEAPTSLAEELSRLEQRRVVLRAEFAAAQKAPPHAVTIPEIDELKRLARESLRGHGADDVGIVRELRRLVPRVVVFPVRLCDGGRIVLRAKLRVRLTELLSDRRAREVLRRPLERVVTLDLFDQPERAAFRQPVLALRASGMTEHEAAQHVGITITAAQHAAALQRRMDELGITDPYVPVLAPPDDQAKMRRHRHPDYRFEPLPGAGEP